MKPPDQMSAMDLPEMAAPAPYADEEAAEGDTAEQGYSCEGKYPLTDPMWTADVQQGQPTNV